MNLSPAIKAQAIAAAIYTTTGIQAQVIDRPGQPPLVSFSTENRRLIQDFLRRSMAHKSDVSIDVLPVIAPLILAKAFVPAAVIVAGIFLTGYFLGKENN